MVYEGQPGEEISGGKKAAPIVNEVFTNILKAGSPEEPLVLLAQNEDAPKAVALTEEDEESDGTPRVETGGQPEARPLPPQTTERRGVAGFFNRLFGR